jgi:transcriptional regulator with XRE-family HTH domain
MGLTQAELAKLLNITQHQVQKNEMGENRVPASRLLEFARILGVSVTWFLHRRDESELVGMPVEVLSDDEILLLKFYRKLDDSLKKHLVDVAKNLKR